MLVWAASPFLLSHMCFKFKIKYGSLSNRSYTNKDMEMHWTATQVEEEWNKENEVSLNNGFSVILLFSFVYRVISVKTTEFYWDLSCRYLKTCLSHFPTCNQKTRCLLVYHIDNEGSQRLWQYLLQICW